MALVSNNSYRTLNYISHSWVCEFGGVERWNGTVEWSTGLDYWSATPTNTHFARSAMTTNAKRLAGEFKPSLGLPPS